MFKMSQKLKMLRKRRSRERKNKNEAKVQWGNIEDFNFKGVENSKTHILGIIMILPK